MRHALVFGGSGQIGRPLLAILQREGWRITAVSRNEQSNEPGLQWLRGELGATVGLPARVDITDAGRALVPRLLDTERRVDRELFGCLEQVARDGLAVALHAVAATHGLDGGRARRIG